VLYSASLFLIFGVAYTDTPVTPVHAQFVATTTVSLTVCGDGLIATNEFCDDGTNTGVYSTTIVGRNCAPACNVYGPYCGDSITQVFYGEECDDGNNTAGDLCDAVCQNETDPVTEGGGGGSGGSGGGGGRGSGRPGIDGAVTEGEIPFEGDTNVIIRGRACPGATVTILRDGEVERVVEADTSAEFNYTLTDQVAGITTFGFWSLDNSSRRSITYSATFQIVENAVTTLSGVLIPPTVAVTPERVSPGGTVSFAGCAVPETNVRAYIDDSEDPEETIAAGNGDWAIAYNTTPLVAEQFHTVKANFIDADNAELKSGFSAITNFYVGDRDVEGAGLTADLNFDGKVNLTDFSILLFNWNTTSALADINKDGTVSLPDFSIMLFYWTG
jgi:cysteine-rich repeat protein